MATFGFGLLRTFTIRFNQPLMPSPPFLPPNWLCYYASRSWNPFGGSISGVNVFVSCNQGDPDPGADRVSYLATPPNVRALDDAAAALPFSDFPIT